MTRPSKQQEIDFLKGYIQLSPMARILEAEALWSKAKEMEPSDKRAILYLLAIESFFMQQETLYKFLKATRTAATGKDYLNILKKTTFNPKQDTTQIFSSDDIKMKYLPHLSESEKEKIKQRINSIIKTCKDLAKANEIFSPVYYCLKHGFLVYKKDGDISLLMHEEKEKRFFDYLKKLSVKGQKDSLLENDFEWIIDLNQRLSCAIQDVIAIRLIQLGVTSL